MPKKEDLIYFLSLELENVRCFGGKQTLELSNDSDKPARWTLLLGENGLGKTTLSECILWMKFVPSGLRKVQNSPEDEITEGPMEPSLPEAENDVIESLVRIGQNRFDLKANFSLGVRLVNMTSNSKKNGSSKTIKTTIGVEFEDQKLEKLLINEEENSRIEDILGGKYKEPFILTYGASRAKGNLSIYKSDLDHENISDSDLAKRLFDRTDLFDAEEVLRYFENKALKSSERVRTTGKAVQKETREERLFAAVKQIVADILPTDEIEVKDLAFYGPPQGVCLNTFSGKDIPFSALSLGYQTTICLALDIAWRLYKFYPSCKAPLDQPAIIIIDEIDLHLHPRWQRDIVSKLAKIFESAQFIATTHSPLMVQSARDVNLAVLKKTDDEVIIENDLEVVYGWPVDQLRVDQILYSPIFGVSSSRGPETEKLYEERAELLKKKTLSPANKKRLNKIKDKISRLPTASNEEDMDFIRRATTVLEKRLSDKK